MYSKIARLLRAIFFYRSDCALSTCPELPKGKRGAWLRAKRGVSIAKHPLGGSRSIPLGEVPIAFFSCKV